MTDTATELRCSDCGEMRPIARFDRDRFCKAGYKGQCRDCVNAKRRARYEAKSEEERRQFRGDPAAHTRYRANHPDRVKDAQRRHLYGITTAEFEELREAQKGACAVCCKSTDRLQVDHDHVTKRVRGLLCGNCNKALGLFADDAARLASAVRYLGGEQ